MILEGWLCFNPFHLIPVMALFLFLRAGRKHLRLWSQAEYAFSSDDHFSFTLQCSIRTLCNSDGYQSAQTNDLYVVFSGVCIWCTICHSAKEYFVPQFHIGKIIFGICIRHPCHAIHEEVKFIIYEFILSSFSSSNMLFVHFVYRRVDHWNPIEPLTLSCKNRPQEVQRMPYFKRGFNAMIKRRKNNSCFMREWANYNLYLIYRCCNVFP